MKYYSRYILVVDILEILPYILYENVYMTNLPFDISKRVDNIGRAEYMDTATSLDVAMTFDILFGPS